MKRNLYALLGLLVVASIILAACGPSATATPESPSAPPPATTDEPTTPASTEESATPTEEPAPATTRRGGWLDEVAMSVVDSGSAVTQITADAIDIYGGNLSTPQDLQAIRDAGLENSEQFGLFYELTFNPVGPEFPATGKLNPFSSALVREAMNWLVDRDYINQEVYGGAGVPKFLPITAGFPDYARYVDLARAIEAKYAYNLDKANEVISAEMEAMGATKDADGKWTYNEEPVTLIFLIRTDSDGTRVPIGDYVSNQLEAIGFTVDRQYKTSSESSPLWVLGDPADGLWHIYTGAWSVSTIVRDQGSNFQFYYTPQSAYAFSPLWQAYDVPADFTEVSEALANNTFTTLEERRDLFTRAINEVNDLSFRIWLIDGKGFSPWRPGISVSYDLAAGVDINQLWPFTLRYADQEGGLVKWGNADLFVDPPNPIAGSNWTFDSQWQNATADYPTLNNPFTGVPLPQRIDRAEVTVQEGLPVTANTDWVSLDFAPQIDVPADAWIDWDPASQTFKTVGEVNPEGLTAKAKAVVYYPENLYDIKWHDGSQMSAGDFIMLLIMAFEPGTEGSAIYDESQAPVLESFKSSFRGIKILSTDPLTIEYYTDTWYMDAEYNVFNNPLSTLWPAYGYGDASWAMIAVSNLAEAAGELAYSADKADALSSETAPVEWMSYIGGPSLEILAKYLDQAAAETYIPYAPTLGQYVTAEEAAARYADLQQWYADHGHFWVGVGPYYLNQVFLVEKSLTLKHNPDYIDLADKWARFSSPKLAEVEIDGAGRATIGAEATFDVYISFQGDPYPADEILEVKYLLFGVDGSLVDVGLAELVADGQYMITLSADTTSKLAAGAVKLEVAVVSSVVSVPSFAAFEFVAE